MSFESNESYAHLAAKNVVAAWLRAASERVGVDEYAWHPICGSWRVCGPAPHYGIWEEYPIATDGTGVCPGWDSVGYFRRPPEADDIIDEGGRLAAVLDIGVIHKGNCIAGVEIVHKHKVTAAKADRLQRLGLQSLVMLPAAWVLGQIADPRSIPDKFRLW